MFRRWMLLIGMLLLGAGVVAAQDAAIPAFYYTAADANGVQQVYQQVDGQAEARQITHAAKDVMVFGAAYDGLSVAYISDAQLWLQPIHTEEAEALATVDAGYLARGPVYSQDGAYIAYPNNGVWLYDLGARETRLLMEDARGDGATEDVNTFRLYQPEAFIMGADGKVSQLIVDTGIWEWNTVGVYDFATDDFSLLEGQHYTSLLPLAEGKALLYGNSGLGGDSGLSLAESRTDLNSYQSITTFAGISDETFYAEQAVEVEAGVVRVIGQALSMDVQDSLVFTFDYDIAAGKAGAFQLITVPNEGENGTFLGSVSPDGNFVAVYKNYAYSDWGNPYGKVEIINLATGESTPVGDAVGFFRWQPQ